MITEVERVRPANQNRAPRISVLHSFLLGAGLASLGYFVLSIAWKVFDAVL